MIASYGQNIVKPSQALGTPFFLFFQKLKLLRDVKNSQGINQSLKWEVFRN